jgi:nicotinamide-nucleotide amidase
VPGVPDEMKEMLERAVLPELRRRSGEQAVILSRTLRTWGYGESRLAEILAPRLEALEASGVGVPTIAFLASGIEGIKVRLTVKAASVESAHQALAGEEAEIRALLGPALFGVDDETMEQAVGELLLGTGLRLGLAEAFTGGLIAARIGAVPGADRWFAGGIVASRDQVLGRLFEVPAGSVAGAEVAAAMADGVRRLLGAEVALSTTRVTTSGAPESGSSDPPVTVFAGLALPGETAVARRLELVGGPLRSREIATITALDMLRRRLLTSSATEHRG